MQDLDEDATVSQLSLAALYIATGQDKIQDAFYIYQELAEKFTPTPLLLNGMATCYILQGTFVCFCQVKSYSPYFSH